MTSPIHYYSEGVRLNLKDRRLLKQWISDFTKLEGSHIAAVNFIFCSDSFLLTLNKSYLNHDTLTDVITFDFSEGPVKSSGISGEIYISLERVRENAREYKVSVQEESCRVMAHGVLHLLGYSDKTAIQKKVMRQKEDLYLSLLLASGKI